MTDGVLEHLRRIDMVSTGRVTLYFSHDHHTLPIK